MLTATRLRSWLLATSVLLVLITACKPEEEAGGEGPVVTTPYQLVLPKGFPQDVRIPATNPLTEEGVALGRMLFYEPRLSRNNTMSCGSCHQQSKAFTDGRALALGVDGVANPRGTMSLANILWEPALNWDGAAVSLETQALKPIENPVELHQSLTEGVSKLQQTELYPPLFRSAFGSRTITEENVLKALAQFERTLISANSRYDKYLRDEVQLNSQEIAGRILFSNHPDPTIPVAGADCMHCHNEGNRLFSSTDYARGATANFFNNGLDSNPSDLGRFSVTGLTSDRGKMRAPTLRNIALTAPYMHDGRFQTLEEVLDHYSDHVAKDSPNLDLNLQTATNKRNGAQLSLSDTQKKQVIAFLRTLTDSTFIQDKRFSDPFKP
ncbi:cytochrome-c peroxidase [Hymenobacter chitinivorans]|uniref:Cytochrome c peroxidase n=1 Tax=Hymenobacter chitinivorans DSM 11115 TaxID=1121954 RepID=A0A2M9BMY2_9BACT|nr:cytochrome c peroxidase [Hymenobacter chitinivorans]PJJ59323.1 cytochrome c peroxidase [Hymenobacter chitinivorans DSM 11115]